MPQQGTVEVDIEAADGSTKSIRVSQLLASLVLRFDDKGNHSLVRSVCVPYWMFILVVQKHGRYRSSAP